MTYSQKRIQDLGAKVFSKRPPAAKISARPGDRKWVFRYFIFNRQRGLTWPCDFETCAAMPEGIIATL